jgi:hypothetical protein
MRITLFTVGLILSLQFAGAQETAPAAPAPEADSTPASTPQAETPGNTDANGNFTPSDKRAFGVLPNYRTVEGSNPFVPLTAKQKLTIATKDTIDGPSYVLAGLFSGLYQLENQNPSFGQGLKGYAHRYVTAIADQDIGNYMTEGFIPVLLHEDPRYFRRGTGSVKGRILRAAGEVVISKTDAGHRTFNVGEFLGNGITASIGNAYYPNEVGFTPTMARMFTQIGTDAFSDVLKEFWPDFKRKVLKKN